MGMNVWVVEVNGMSTVGFHKVEDAYEYMLRELNDPTYEISPDTRAVWRRTLKAQYEGYGKSGMTFGWGPVKARIVTIK